MAGDANFNVRKMILKKLSASDLNGGVSTDYAMTQIATAIYAEAGRELAQEVANSLYTLYANSWLSTFALVYTVGDILITIASVENTQSRNYFVYAPVAGIYTFDVSLPGDWDLPCNMIKIYSIDTQGVETLQWNYDHSLSSNQVIHQSVALPKGLCHINVSLGSGSVKFHTAGSLQQAMLNNPTAVSWTVPLTPVTIKQIGLSNYLPSVGDTAAFSSDIVLPPTPSNILDGSVTYSNIHPIPAVFPYDQKNTLILIDIYGEPTPDDLAQIGQWPYINMKASQVGNAVDTGNGGIWTITRLPDYTTTCSVRFRLHPY